MAVNDKRKQNTLTYIKDWHGSFWSLHTTSREGIAQRIAENVTCYHELLNLPAYTRVAQEMLDDGTIKVLELGPNKSLALSTEED